MSSPVAVFRRLVGVDPKTGRRNQPPTARQCIENARKGYNPEVREEMKAIVRKRRRIGNRRIGVLLERKGMTVNHKKRYRLDTAEKLGIRWRRGRKRARIANTNAGGFASV